MDLEDLESIKSLAKEKIEKINTEREWIDTKAYFLGKKGIIPSLLAKLPELSQEQKKIYGQSINTVKVFIESLLEKQLKIIKAKEIEKKTFSEYIRYNPSRQILCKNWSDASHIFGN